MKAKKYLRIPAIPLWWPDLSSNWRAWLPSRGNVLFTLLMVAGLLWASNAGALPLRIPSAAGTSTGTIAYQGRLADSAGTPITDTVNMEFRLYDVAEGGTPLWNELWTGSNAVRVSDGLFNVMLGSLEPIPQAVVSGHDQLWLGITVGTDDEMTPRVQLGSVPFAVQALTVPDGSISSKKLSLNRGTACLPNHVTVDLPGDWQRGDIPGLILSFSLENDSSTLVWIDGLAKFSGESTSNEFGVDLWVDDILVTSDLDFTPDRWFNVNGLRILGLGPGTHTLKATAYAKLTGQTTIHGVGGYRTCINYLMLGQ